MLLLIQNKEIISKVGILPIKHGELVYAENQHQILVEQSNQMWSIRFKNNKSFVMEHESLQKIMIHFHNILHVDKKFGRIYILIKSEEDEQFCICVLNTKSLKKTNLKLSILIRNHYRKILNNKNMTIDKIIYFISNIVIVHTERDNTREPNPIFLFNMMDHIQIGQIVEGEINIVKNLVLPRFTCNQTIYSSNRTDIVVLSSGGGFTFFVQKHGIS